MSGKKRKGKKGNVAGYFNNSRYKIQAAEYKKASDQLVILLLVVIFILIVIYLLFW